MRSGTAPLEFSRPPVLILLHQAGINEQTFLSVAAGVDARWLVASVRGPIAQSRDAFAWYRLSPFDITQPNLEDIRRGTERLGRTIEEIIASANADARQVYLMGADQGAAMAVSVLLSYPRLVTGVMAFAATKWEDMRYSVVERDALKEKPVFLAYGAHDTVLPLQVARQVRGFCLEYGMEVTYREYSNVGHTLNRRVLADMLSWMAERAERVRRRMRHVDTRARLGYAVLRVRNLERSLVFYQRFLGLRLVERVGSGYAFLSGSARHHDLALIQVGTDALDQPPGIVGVERIAFELPDPQTFARTYQRLCEQNIPLKTVDRMIAWVMSFADPDGNRIEAYCDRRDLPGAADLWQGRDLPLPPEKILAALQAPSEG